MTRERNRIHGWIRQSLIVAVSSSAASGCGSEAPLEGEESGATAEQHEERDEKVDAGRAGATDEGAATPDGGAASDARWQPCPALTDVEDDTREAECITVDYPMRRSVEGEPVDGEGTLEVFFKRFPAPEPVTGQLWLLAGGPGFPGTILERSALRLQDEHPSLEVYVPDHRGTGRSTLFDCLDAEASFEQYATSNDFLLACSRELVDEWGEDLSWVSVTEAAYDVTSMMLQTQRPDVPITALGVSYGGYWLHRVLQVGGSLIDSAIFDSPLRPVGGMSVVDLMLEPEQAGLELLDACAEDPECSERLGSDPAVHALDIVDGGGACAGIVEAGFDRAWVQYTLAEALKRRSFRGLIPAVLYRLERCDPPDVEFIVAFRDAVLDRANPFDRGPPSVPTTAALARQINLSEVFAQPATEDDVIVASNASIFGSLGPTLAVFEGEQQWHRYAPDEWVGQWADTSPNILILQGSFDAVTPPRYARELSEQFAGPNQYYFEIDYAAHGAVGTSHEVQDDRSCGAHIQDQFLNDPSSAPDGGCASEAPSFEFSADEELLLELLGHTDVWDNPDSDLDSLVRDAPDE